MVHTGQQWLMINLTIINKHHQPLRFMLNNHPTIHISLTPSLFIGRWQLKPRIRCPGQGPAWILCLRLPDLPELRPSPRREGAVSGNQVGEALVAVGFGFLKKLFVDHDLWWFQLVDFYPYINDGWACV